ncbi:hypothetical protein LMIY3S_00965 [Labrys miyagiensis]
MLAKRWLAMFSVVGRPAAVVTRLMIGFGIWCGLGGASLAENYFGGSIGYGFDAKVTGVKGNENTNYPDPPDPVGGFPLLRGASLTDLSLGSTPMLGFRLGHFFENTPWFGLEAALSYSRPEFKHQPVTLTHPGFVDLIGTPSVTEEQLPARSGVFRLAVDGIARYGGWGRITPYVGAGPAMFIWHISGTGHSGITAFDPVGVFGPRIDENVVTWGADLKAGIEYKIDEQWATGLEYHYDWSRMHIDNFRSLSHASGNFNSQDIELTLSRRF